MIIESEPLTKRSYVMEILSEVRRVPDSIRPEAPAPVDMFAERNKAIDRISRFFFIGLTKVYRK